MKKVPAPQSCDNLPVVILVRPQLAENMGMVARAMMNAGLYNLRLVHPRENHLSDKAVAASSGSAIILENAFVFETLEDAVADLNYVLATTSRERGMTKPVYHPEKAAHLINEKLNSNQKCGILFGAERTGLENHELIIADGIIEIPLNPAHTSLNLSQAVLLIGYEWLKSKNKIDNSHMEMGGSTPATKQDLEAFFRHLEEVLTQKGYFRFDDKKERMQRNLRNIFTRTGLTTSEINTLHGIVNELIREKHD